MAIGGIEWVIVGVIAVVMIVWGPDQIPKLARMLGQARQQFELAQKEFANATLEQPAAVSAPAPAPAPALSPAISTTDQTLIDAAQRLGIQSKGKTRDELTAEIARRAVQTASVPAPQASGSQASPQSQATGTAPALAPSNPAVGMEKDEHERLVVAARGLGINTEGKTTEQLKAEMRNALA